MSFVLRLAAGAHIGAPSLYYAPTATNAQTRDIAKAARFGSRETASMACGILNDLRTRLDPQYVVAELVLRVIEAAPGTECAA